MKILVATDGSKPALRAVKYAVKLIGWLQLVPHTVTLISVHDNTYLRFANSILGSEDVIAFLHEQSKAELKDGLKILKAASIEHRSEIRTGHVAQEIVQFAKNGKFDLIVLGSKGRGGIFDLLVGSVAQRVLATAGADQPVAWSSSAAGSTANHRFMGRRRFSVRRRTDVAQGGLQNDRFAPRAPPKTNE